MRAALVSPISFQPQIIASAWVLFDCIICSLMECCIREKRISLSGWDKAFEAQSRIWFIIKSASPSAEPSFWWKKCVECCRHLSQLSFPCLTACDPFTQICSLIAEKPPIYPATFRRAPNDWLPKVHICCIDFRKIVENESESSLTSGNGKESKSESINQKWNVCWI